MGFSATIFKDGAAGEAVRKITESYLLKVTRHLGKNPELGVHLRAPRGWALEKGEVLGENSGT